MRRIYGFSVAGFAAMYLLMLMASCSKEAADENLPEPVPPYELRLTPPGATFESRWFEDALENGDKSVFSKTILISGGTAPYRIEPEKDVHVVYMSGGREINIKMTDFLKVTAECVPSEQDRIIVELLHPEIMLYPSPEFTIYDKNGGCAKFFVFDRDIIVGP